MSSVNERIRRSAGLGDLDAISALWRLNRRRGYDPIEAEKIVRLVPWSAWRVQVNGHDEPVWLRSWGRNCDATSAWANRPRRIVAPFEAPLRWTETVRRDIALSCTMALATRFGNAPSMGRAITALVNDPIQRPAVEVIGRPGRIRGPADHSRQRRLLDWLDREGVPRLIPYSQIIARLIMLLNNPRRTRLVREIAQLSCPAGALAEEQAMRIAPIMLGLAWVFKDENQ